MATSTLGSGTLVLAGTTSGTTTVTATAVAGTTTLTLPAATDTLVGKATTDTLTNKTLGAVTLGGTVAGGGNQINNVIVGTTNPLAGAFTTLSAGNTTLTGTSALTVNRSGAQGTVTLQNNGTSTGILIAGVTNGLVFYDAVAGLQMGTWAYSAGLAVTGAIGVGGATPTTSGTGITFPATQSASSDANTLDDYEEGTITSLTDGSGAGLSITFNNAKYTKIGRLVYISISTIVYPVTASTAAAIIAGLPFTNTAADVGSSTLISNNANANRALVASNSTTIFFYPTSSTGQSLNNQLSGAIIYGFSAVYQV